MKGTGRGRAGWGSGEGETEGRVKACGVEEVGEVGGVGRVMAGGEREECWV